MPRCQGDVVNRLPAPDHKTIADFPEDNGAAIWKVCAKFVALCWQMGLLQTPSAAIANSNFKAMDNSGRNFTHANGEADGADRGKRRSIFNSMAPIGRSHWKRLASKARIKAPQKQEDERAGSA